MADAQAQVIQLTDHASTDCAVFSPSANAAGDLIAFESTCDLTGTNVDGNREIFQVDDAGVVVQLTDSADCSNANPSSNADGTAVAFDSDCDLAAANVDGSFEIFLASGGGVQQLTVALACASLAPSINAAGNLVAFDSDCDFLGLNFDRSSEIFQVTDGGLISQLTSDTNGSGCGCFAPSSNEAGDLVAFESDCDLAGQNEDEISEIFSVTSAGVVTQLTVSPDDACLSLMASSDAAGDDVAFESDCDFTGANPDNSIEVFRVSSLGTVEQLSDDAGDSACESSAPAMSDDGLAVVFTSFCDPLGRNADKGIEIFRVNSASTQQLTSGENCVSLAPTLHAGTVAPVVYLSDCDPATTNADGSEELFEVTPCTCGTPVSGDRSVKPTDSLFVLQASTGAKVCDLCSCDVNDSGSISPTDALLVLQAAVSLPVDLVCP